MARYRFRSPGSVIVLLLSLQLTATSSSTATTSSDGCRLVNSLRAEIAGYRPIVDRVLSYVRDSKGYKGRTWTELSEFTDLFGYRLAGTPNLENSIDLMLNKLRAMNLDNVHGERVEFNGWQRYTDIQY